MDLLGGLGLAGENAPVADSEGRRQTKFNTRLETFLVKFLTFIQPDPNYKFIQKIFNFFLSPGPCEVAVQAVRHSPDLDINTHNSFVRFL